MQQKKGVFCVKTLKVVQFQHFFLLFFGEKAFQRLFLHKISKRVQ